MHGHHGFIMSCKTIDEGIVQCCVHEANVPASASRMHLNMVYKTGTLDYQYRPNVLCGISVTSDL